MKKSKNELKQLQKALQLKEEAKYEESIAICREIIPIFEEAEDWEQYAETVNLWSENLWRNGKFDESIQQVEVLQNKTSKFFGESHPSFAFSYKNLGTCYFFKGEFQQALTFFHRGLKIALTVFGENHILAAGLYSNISMAHVRIEEYTQAIEHQEKALNIRLEIFTESHAHTADSYLNLGFIHFQQGNLDSALAFYQKAWQIRIVIRDENHPTTALCCLNIGNTWFKKGDYTKAIEFMTKALVIQKKILSERHPDISMAYNNLGVCFEVKGNYSKALQYYQKTLKLRLSSFGENHFLTATAYMNLGNIYYTMGDTEKGIVFNKKALKIQLETLGEKHSSTAFTYRNLGMYCDRKGEDKAIIFLEKSLKIQQFLFDDADANLADTYTGIGKYYQRRYQINKATNYHLKALEVRAKFLKKNHPENAMSYINLEDCSTKQKNYKQALYYIQKSLQCVVSKYNHTNFYHNPACRSYSSPEHLFQTLNTKPTTFYCIYQQSNFLKNLAAAIFTTQTMLKWIDHVRQSFSNDGSKIILAQKNYNAFKESIQIAYHAAQIATENPKEWKTVTREIAQINHDSWNKEDFDYCWTAHDCLHSAFDICEKSRAMILLSNLKEEEAKGQSLIPKYLLQKEYDLKVELNFYDKKIKQEEYKKAAEHNERQIVAWQSQFFDYQQEYDALIEHLEKEYPNYYELKYQVETVVIEQLQSQLNVSKSLTSTSTAILQYFIAEKNLYLFTITATDYQVFEISKPQDFEELIHDFLYSINKRIKADYLELSHELYALLLTPAISQLDLKKDTQLVIIPDGILNQVPFEALLTQKVKGNPNYADLPYLLIKYDVSYHFSATLWHRSSLQQQKQANQTQVLEDNFIGFAPVYVSKKEREEGEVENHEKEAKPLETVLVEETRDIKIGDENYKSLIHSEKEVQQIAQLFQRRSKKAITQLHEQATTQHFIDKTPFFKYILVAAHADFQVSRPELTGIIFSPEANATEKEIDELGIQKTYYDHILYLSDTYHLNLQNTDLLVLSCCETGIGKLEQGEGVMALHRGFLFAGAKNIVSTLFKIPDKQSSELTQALFRYILEGKSYRSALRLAKLELIAKREMPPVYWSGFVLIGN